jgi:acetyltransferase
MEELDGFLPAPWSHGNPVDVLGDATPDRYARTLEVAADDPESDGLLVILTPQDMTDPTGTAEALTGHAGGAKGKPVLASWMGGPDVAPGVEVLNRAGIPTFDYPDAAARVFANMWRYTYNLRAIYETPDLAEEGDVADHDRVEEVIEAAGARAAPSSPSTRRRRSSPPTASPPSRRASRPPPRRPSRPPAPSATPSSSSSTPRPSPTRRTSAA